MEKIKLDGETIRKKDNILLWKDKIIIDTNINEHNYWMTIRIMTKNDGQIFFTLNNTDIKKLIIQKEKEHDERVKKQNKLIYEYIEKFWY